MRGLGLAATGRLRGLWCGRLSSASGQSGLGSCCFCGRFLRIVLVDQDEGDGRWEMLGDGREVHGTWGVRGGFFRSPFLFGETAWAEGALVSEDPGNGGESWTRSTTYVHRCWWTMPGVALILERVSRSTMRGRHPPHTARQHWYRPSTETPPQTSVTRVIPPPTERRH